MGDRSKRNIDSRGDKAAFREDARTAARFAGIALILLVGSYVFVTSKLASRIFTERYCAHLAGVVRAGLRAVGVGAHGEGPYVVLSNYSLHLTASCSAVDITAVVMGLMIAFPARWRDRFMGIATAGVLLFAMNILRIALLVVMGSRRDEHLHDVHMIYAQGLMILVGIGMWLYWVLNWSAYAKPVRGRVYG